MDKLKIEYVDINNIKSYIKEQGGFEKFAEWRIILR